MTPARIAELLEPFLEGQSLSPEHLSHISTYVDILTRWNTRINLTAIRDPEQIVTRHFGESLFAARHLFPGPAQKAIEVADLGSGAGFPGLPIKLWAPNVSLTLIESNHKKATFLRETVRSLTLTGANVQNARAESLPAHSYDVVTLRAVERFDAILPVASSLVTEAGRLALLIGTAQLAQLPTAMPLHTISEALTIPSSSSRVLAVVKIAGK